MEGIEEIINEPGTCWCQIRLTTGVCAGGGRRREEGRGLQTSFFTHQMNSNIDQIDDVAERLMCHQS